MDLGGTLEREQVLAHEVPKRCIRTVPQEGWVHLQLLTLTPTFPMTELNTQHETITRSYRDNEAGLPILIEGATEVPRASGILLPVTMCFNKALFTKKLTMNIKLVL